MRTRRNWIIAGVAAVCFVTAVALSHLIEPGVHVQKVTLAEETPALEFIPVGSGPHSVALLAHGYAGSKETLFRYGEGLAAAGFICYDVDLPGHGASPRTWTVMDTVHTLEAVAHKVGPVDVFIGHSMGGFTGGEAVREGGMRPGIFIAIGSMPVLGDHAQPLLFLAGRFEEALPSGLLKTRTDARLVISPWSDHLLEKVNLTPLNLTRIHPVIPSENILLMEGIYDFLCPKDDIKDLWQTWGQPDIWRLPHGHVGICCGFPPGFTGRVLHWLAPRLEAGPKTTYDRSSGQIH